MDALSLSHLTYCCATITVNFHRLDHPPFPCKSRLLLIRFVDKCPQDNGRRYIRHHHNLHHIAGCAYLLRGKATTPHEAGHHHWNTPHHPWHHRICYRRNLLHPPEKRCGRGSDSDLPQDSGHASDLADSEHYLADSRRWPGCCWSKSKVANTNVTTLGLRRYWQQNYLR
jgi:hypothetical protein